MIIMITTIAISIPAITTTAPIVIPTTKLQIIMIPMIIMEPSKNMLTTKTEMAMSTLSIRQTTIQEDLKKTYK